MPHAPLFHPESPLCQVGTGPGRGSRYYLPDHVHACRTDEGVVFLDARKDEYFGLGGEHIGAIGQLILNWPNATAACMELVSVPESELLPIAHSLAQRGLLAEGTPSYLAPRSAIVPPLEMPAPRISTALRRAARPVDILRFVCACSRAILLLKSRSIEHIAAALTRRRQALELRDPAHTDEAMALAALFRRLRALLLSEKDRCLFNALSLTYFLLEYQLPARWVIGVKTSPFAAHSWVQIGAQLLDGDPACVCHFVPIMAA